MTIIMSDIQDSVEAVAADEVADEDEAPLVWL
jgi:hypothetical protein